MTVEPMIITIWIVALVISAVGGYYVTRGVLFLAQRRATKEDKSHAVDLPAPDPAQAAENAVAEDGADVQAASADATEASGGPDGPDSAQAKAGLRGGMWIGILERVLITAFFMTGFTTGIAVVIAVKGLGRYPELNGATSERFIIGTLASLLWAFTCGSLGLRLTH